MYRSSVQKGGRMKEVKNVETEIYGNNQLIGYFDDYAVVYDEESEELFFFEAEPAEELVGTCVEQEQLRDIEELPEHIQEAIYHEFF